MVSEHRKERAMDLYPFPEHVTVSNFVTLKLDDTNYMLWKTQVESLLNTQKLIGFVNGREKKPAESIRVKFDGTVSEVSNPDYEAWFQTDQLIKSWLFGTLSPSVLGYVYSLQTSCDVWLMLAERFNQCSISREFDLLSALQGITKRDRPLTEYLEEFKNLCDQLSAIGKPVSEPMKIFRLLEGLGREYESLVTVIQSSMQKLPTPTYTDVVSQLTGFDNRLKRYAPAPVSPHLAFQVQNSETTTSNFSNQKGGYRGRGGYRGHGGAFSTKGRGFSQQISQALKCYDRFNNAYQSTDIPQALAAMTISNTPAPSEWYTDSRATSHITGSTANLQDSISYSGNDSVMVGDGNFLPITHVGSSSLSTTSGVCSGQTHTGGADTGKKT